MIQAVSEVIVMLPPVEFTDTTAQLRQENVELVRKLAAANVMIEKMKPVVEAAESWNVAYESASVFDATQNRITLSEAVHTYRHWLKNQETIRRLQEAMKHYERDDQNGR